AAAERRPRPRACLCGRVDQLQYGGRRALALPFLHRESRLADSFLLAQLRLGRADRRRRVVSVRDEVGRSLERADRSLQVLLADQRSFRAFLRLEHLAHHLTPYSCCGLARTTQVRAI